MPIEVSEYPYQNVRTFTEARFQFVEGIAHYDCGLRWRALRRALSRRETVRGLSSTAKER